MITITIIGILAASVTYGVGDYIKEKRAEQNIIAIWSQLSTIRARAIRDDTPYFVKFTPSNGTYVLYKDHPTAGNEAKRFFENISGKIEFGFATPAPASNVLGGTTYNTSDNIQGEWKTYVDVKDDDADGNTADNITNTIAFRNDEIGTINDGAIFLKNPNLPKHAYAIVKEPKTHTIKLFKWDGSKWYEM